jgi:heptosyltransferase-1
LPRILFVKTSSLGDVVHNCPAVTDVAREMPGAVIDWVVEEPFAGVAALHASVRRVIPVAIRRWRSAMFARATWSEMAEFRARLAGEAYDAVIDTQGLLKSALVARLAHGRRHGFDRASVRESYAARFYDERHAVRGDLHAVERNRQLASQALGYPLRGACDYGLRADRGLPAPSAGPYVLLLTMTSRDDKLWPEERWRSLGGELARAGLRCLLPWGTQEERLRCQRIATAIPGAEVPERMAIGELARLARGARCVAGVDTGLAHLSAAVGAPVIGIYTGSEPALTGLYGSARVRNLGGPGRAPEPREVLAALEGLGALLKPGLAR